MCPVRIRHLWKYIPDEELYQCTLCGETAIFENQEDEGGG